MSDALQVNQSSKQSNVSNLLLLFTYQSSLKVWMKHGLIDRELGYYQIMKEFGLNQVFLMTYDYKNKPTLYDSAFFQILPNYYFRYHLIYSLLAPFVHWSAFQKADIVKSNQSLGAWTGLVSKILMPKKPFVLRCGWIQTEEKMKLDNQLSKLQIFFKKFVEWLCFRFSDLVIVPSQPDRQYVETHYNLPSDKVKIIPTSIDTDIFKPSDRQLLQKEPIKIIAIGRLVEMKNFQNLFLAVKDLNYKTEITLIGDGEYKDFLIKLAENLDINIRFLSWIPNHEIPEYLGESDIFVIPQLYGTGLSKVMREAMSCGLIVIGSDIVAHREVIKDGSNGFLCGTDSSSILECLERILSLDKKSIHNISAEARNNVVENYSMRKNAQKELELLKTLLNKRK